MKTIDNCQVNCRAEKSIKVSEDNLPDRPLEQPPSLYFPLSVSLSASFPSSLSLSFPLSIPLPLAMLSLLLALYLQGLFVILFIFIGLALFTHFSLPFSNFCCCCCCCWFCCCCLCVFGFHCFVLQQLKFLWPNKFSFTTTAGTTTTTTTAQGRTGAGSAIK